MPAICLKGFAFWMQMNRFSKSNTNAYMHVHVWVWAFVWMSVILCVNMCELVERSDIFPTDEMKVTLIISIGRAVDLGVILKWIFTCSLSPTERLHCNGVSTKSVEILHHILFALLFTHSSSKFCRMAAALHCLVKLVQDWKLQLIMIMKWSKSMI